MLANDQLMYDEIYKFLKRIICHAICLFVHQLNIISKKNEPVLLFKTNNLGNEASKHEHGLKLENVGPS